MSNETASHLASGPERRPLFAIILRDAHFWIPLAVLAGGLLLLRWIS